MAQNDEQLDIGLNLRNWNRDLQEMETRYNRTIADLIQETARFDKRIDDLDSDVDIKAKVDDSEIDSADRKRLDLEDDVSIKANVDDSEIDTAEGLLQQLRNLAVIDIVFQVGEKALGVIQTVASPLSAIDEMDRALDRLDAAVAESFPGAEKLIVDLWTGGWGESRTEIARTIEEAQRAGAEGEEIADAVFSAFFLRDLNEEFELAEILRAEASLVRSGVVPDFKTAGDLIATAFINGADIGDDLLDTLWEYSPDFAAFELSGEEVANIIIGGIEGGFRNADVAGDAIREFKIRLTADFNEEFQGALADIDMLDEAELFRQGELDGAEFLAGVTAEIQRLLDEGEVAEANRIAALLFGPQVEDAGAAAAAAMNPFITQFDEEMEGAAERASATINDNIGVGISQVLRTLEEKLRTFLEDKLNVGEILEQIQTDITEFFAALDEGEGIIAAAEIALDAPELSNQINDLQQGLTRFIIELLGGLAGVIDAIGKIPGIDTSSEGIRSIRSALSSEVLGLDLALADPANINDFVDSIQLALDRGVEEADIQTTIANKIVDFASGGDVLAAQNLQRVGEELFDFETLGEQAAQQLFGAFSTAIEEGNIEGAESIAFLLGNQADQAMLQEQIAGLSEPIPQETIEGVQTLSEAIQLATDNLTTFDEGRERTAALVEAFQTGGMEEVNRVLSEFEGINQDLPGAVDETTESVEQLGDTATEKVGEADESFSLFSDGVILKSAEIAEALDLIITRFTWLADPTNTNLDFSMQTGTNGNGTTVINNTTNNGPTISQTNNVQSNAQAQAAGQQVINGVRGFGQ